MKKAGIYVLSCIDGSTHTQSVCDYSHWIANKIKAPLKLLHTIEHRDTPAVADLSGAIGLGASEDLLNELAEAEKNHSRLLIQKGNVMLQAAKQKALAAGVEQVEVRQKHGGLAEALIDMEEQIRVLVVGVAGEEHDQDNAGVGAQLESTIRSLHKPILVVNRPFSIPIKVMLAYNGSGAANKALDMVAASPLFKGIPCHVVYVSDSEAQAQQVLSPAVNKLQAAGIEAVAVTLSDGAIEEALSAYQAQENIDLTVMGAFSHSRVRDFLMGSFTAKMLAMTNKPLLLLR